MSPCCRILLSNVIFNRIKQHFELPQAKLSFNSRLRVDRHLGTNCHANAGAGLLHRDS